MMAAMLAFAGTAMAQENELFSVDPVVLDENGNGKIVVNLNYQTEEAIVGYNFSLLLPEGVKGANAKTGKVTGSGKVTTASVVLNSEVHPMCWNADDEDFTKDPKDWLQLKDKSGDGVAAGFAGYLFVWIDQDKKLPLLKTVGEVLTVAITADPSFSGEAEINTIALSNKDNVSVGGPIAAVKFAIGEGTVGINDIQSADATAPAYNLQGIRVNNAKGLIIRDGKKMVVK